MNSEAQMLSSLILAWATPGWSSAENGSFIYQNGVSNKGN